MSASPKISVIVLTYERPEPLRACLAALAEQTYPLPDFEVVVVDGSASPACQVIDSFRRRLPINHLIRANAGVAAGRNRGVEAAQAEFVAFIDDDCVADSDWLASMTAALQAEPDALIGGAVINGRPGNIIAVAGQVISETVDDFYNPPGVPARFVPGLNFSLATERFRSLGGCDEAFGLLAAEDRDFIDRWRAAGGRISKCRRAVVQHHHRATLRGFIRQYFHYGRGAFRYHRLRRRRGPVK